ncbi:MAG: mechanosensitive ion channel family protein [Bryobacteraceae bacterium]|nr:mechanosensitive ion channel family protein [Bryobacteraceae bacterium]
MTVLPRAAGALLFACLLQAQIPLPGLGEPAAAKPSDPLGRDTPRATALRFMQAAQAGKFSAASQYLQLSDAERQARGARLASELRVVLDKTFSGSLETLSNRAEGSIEDGRPDQERAGQFTAGDREADFILVRVLHPTYGQIWLIANETVRQVPALYAEVGPPAFVERLPSWMTERHIWSMALWQWIAIALAILPAIAAAWVQLWLFGALWKLVTGQRPVLPVRVSRPLWAVYSLVLHLAFFSQIGVPLLFRFYYQRLIAMAMFAGIGVLLWRFIDWSGDRMKARSVARLGASVEAAILLGGRVLKAIVFVVIVIAILNLWGVQTGAAVAGLGIGGLAIAFGAQKTVENFIGGVSVLSDDVIRVGDTIRFGGVTGNIEDISLRSTRVRTVEHTLVTIPNGTLATMNLENLTARGKILFQSTMNVRYETTPEQMRYLLAELRKLLHSHPMVESPGCRARLAGFTDAGLIIEVFAFVLTTDFAQYLAVREDLLLRTMDVISDAGTAFAFPGRTLYVGRDVRPAPEDAGRAAAAVAGWRQSGKLPFPDFPEEEMVGLRDRTMYPPAGSPLATPPVPAD